MRWWRKVFGACDRGAVEGLSEPPDDGGLKLWPFLLAGERDHPGVHVEPAHVAAVGRVHVQASAAVPVPLPHLQLAGARGLLGCSWPGNGPGGSMGSLRAMA